MWQATLLHLTDLHFGWDGSTANRDNRNLALKSLSNALAALESEWRPTIICISGDLGWRGHKKDYELAKEWLSQLLTRLSLSANNVIVCPGNHDVDWHKATGLRPRSGQEADKVLQVPIKKHFQKPFQALINFCKDMGIPPLLMGHAESYLVGVRTIQGIKFVCYNSAWFCQGDDDKGNLWIGLPLIKHMEAKGQIPRPQELREWPITVALLHHPKEWFAEAEIRAEDNPPRVNTFDFLASRCHLLLTGHTHGEVRRADQYGEATWHLSGGAAYAGPSHFNSFRIVRVEAARFLYLAFEFDPRSAATPWRPQGDARALRIESNLKLQSQTDQDGKSGSVQPKPPDLGAYKKAVAERFRTVRLLNRQLHIDQHYFPLNAADPSPENVDAVPSDALKLLQSEQYTRVCLIGPSGAGKTASVRRFLWEAVESDLVPFIISLRDYIEPHAEGLVPLREWLKNSVNLYSMDVRTTKALFEMIDLRQGLFIFDGFDELRSDPRWAARIAEAIEAYFSDSGRCRILMTSRTKEDLQGRFAGFRQLILNPIDITDIEGFSSTIGPEFAQSATELRDIAKRRLFELRPVMLLTAIFYMHRAGQSRGIESLFQLLDKALSELLIDKIGSAAPPVGRIAQLTADQIRDIRLRVLMRMVEEWPVSARPCRISEHDLRDHVLSSIFKITGSDVAGTSEEMRYLIPTGICLEHVNVLGERQFGFVHNSIQEFLYARVLLDAISRSDPRLLARDYYSPEILQLLSEELDAKNIGTLLKWLTNPEMYLMVKKVSACLLGFVKNIGAFPGLINELEKAFDDEQDVGVGGRIAEALRRQSKPRAIHKFVSRLDKYPARGEIEPSSQQSRPLTFEIDQPLDGLEELVPALYEYLKHPNPVVRKHALILLMRVRTRIERHTLVRYCLREVENLETLRESEQWQIVDPLVRSLRYGLAALSRYGSSMEEPSVRRMRARLARLPSFSLDREVSEQFTEVIRELHSRHWFSNAALNDSGEQPEYRPAVYLVRHAESEGNTLGRIVGSQLEGGLTQRGLVQAEAVATTLKDRVKGKIVLVASPADRALATARAVAERFSCEIETDQRLIELDFGSWSGHVWEEIASQDPHLFKAWRENPEDNHPPEGESLFEVRSRVFEALADWVERAFKERKTLVIITHFFPLKAICGALGNQWAEVDLDNCAISGLRLESGRWFVEFINDTGHLSKAGFKPVSW